MIISFELGKYMYIVLGAISITIRGRGSAGRMWIRGGGGGGGVGKKVHVSVRRRRGSVRSEKASPTTHI